MYGKRNKIQMERAKAKKTARRLVERDRRPEQRVDDVRVVVELLVYHEGEDAHLCRATVVQLDARLASLLSLAPSVGVHPVLAVLLDRRLLGCKTSLQKTDEYELQTSWQKLK